MSRPHHPATDLADASWRSLFWLSGIAAITILALMLVSVAGFIAWPYAAGTTPTREIFALLQTNIWAGFIAVDLGLSISNLLSILVYLGLYGVLRRVHATCALVALVVGLVAVAALVAARPVLEVMTLSSLHASAATAAEQSRYLAAGESLLVQFHGAAWHTSMLLGAVASLINALVMRRSQVFGRVLPYVGVVTFTAGLFFWLPVVGLPILFLVMLGSVPWYVLLAMHFSRMGHQAGLPQTWASSHA